MTEVLEKREFETVVDKHHYRLPCYKITPNGIERNGEFVDVKFVRGDKTGEGNPDWKDGTLHEHLLSMMIADLEAKNAEVPSREGSLVITKLQEARLWMLERQVDRAQRNVQGTYKK